MFARFFKTVKVLTKGIACLFISISAVNTMPAQQLTLQAFCNDAPKALANLNYKRNHGDSISAVKELSKIISRLRLEGYLLAQVDSTQSSTTSINAFITCGSTYKTSRIARGNLDLSLAYKLGYREQQFADKPFHYNELELLCEKILRHYENTGYPFASVQLDSVKIDGTNIAAVLNVQKNKLYRIDSVIIKGNAKINMSYLQRYLNLKQGMLYNEQTLAAISTKIRQLPFLTEKQTQRVQLTQRENKLILFLDKKNASQFDGIIGILPDANTKKTVITGDVKLKLVNGILHNGETFDVEWRRLQSQTQDFNAKLLYPYMLRSPLGLDYAIKVYRKDSSFSDVNNNIGLQYFFSALNYFKVFYKVRSSNLISTLGLDNITTLPDYADISTNAYGFGLSFEKLDYRFNPRKGSFLQINAQTGQRTIRKNPAINDLAYNGLNLNSTQFQFDLHLSVYIPIATQQTIKFNVQAASVFGNEQVYKNELFRIGGLKTLRGFDEESIYASSFVIPTLEYRFLFARNSNLLLFAEGAWYENNSNRQYFSDRPVSVGAGINFDTKAGIFSMYYALGNQQNNGFDVRNGKIHFGLTALF